MNAANRGLSRPNAARTMPIASTPMVPAKFVQMILRVRRAIKRAAMDANKEIDEALVTANLVVGPAQEIADEFLENPHVRKIS